MRSLAWAGVLAAILSAPASAQRLSPEAERLLAAARAQGMRITPEQAQRLADRQREIVARLGGMGAGAASADPAPAPEAAAAPAAATEAELGAMVATAGRAARRVDLAGTTKVDLVVDDRAHVDPEGDLHGVAADAERNVASYLVGVGSPYAVKTAPLTDLRSAREVGRLSVKLVGGLDMPRTRADRANGWLSFNTSSRVSFEGATGVRMAGTGYDLLPDGVMVWRDRAAAIYRYGSGVATHAIPAGFYPAEKQNGEVGATGVLLIRRDHRGEGANAGAVRAFKGLFSSVGVVKAAADFALFDTTTGKVTPLPIEDIGQEESMSDGPQGQSETHYYWRARWMKLGGRRFAVHFAKLKQRMLVTDLDSGKTAEAFNRGLGITSWTFTPDGRGTGKLVARWMSQDHAIDDMVRWFDAAPAAAS